VNFIQVHKWNNPKQTYIYVGDLICDNKMNKGYVSFHYDNEYVKNGGASLDPKNLNLNQQSVFICNEGEGQLPAYFRQYLPTGFAAMQIALYEQKWDSFSQFEQLDYCSRFYGDHIAIQLNPHQQQQDNYVLTDNERIINSVHSIHQFKPAEGSIQSLSQPKPSVNAFQGARPKLEYADPKTGQRWIAKPSNNPFYDEGPVRLLTHKLYDSVGVDCVSTQFLEIPSLAPIATQANFRQAFFPMHSSKALLKFNCVPFDVLCDKPHQALTFKDLADVIVKYSSAINYDLKQLHLRGLMDASLNVTRNHINNLYMVDIGVNQWRLAPSFSAMPNPNASELFAIPFSYRHTSRSLFTPNEDFSHFLGQAVGVSEVVAIKHWDAVNNTLNNINELSRDFDHDTINILKKSIHPHTPFDSDLNNTLDEGFTPY
jgi:hypothetical protein